MINFIICLILFFVSPLISTFFKDNRLTLLLRISSVTIILGALYKIPLAIILRNLSFKIKGLLDFFSKVISGVVTLVLAISDKGVWSLVFGFIAYDLSQLFFCYFYSKWRPCISLNFNEIKDLLMYGIKYTFFRIAKFFSNKVDTVIVGKLLGVNILGYYTFSYQLAAIPNEKIGSILNQLFFPFFSRLQSMTLQEKENVYYRINNFFLFLLFPLFFLLIMNAPLFIPLLFTEKWLPSVFPFQILCYVFLLKTLDTIRQQFVLANGYPGFESKFWFFLSLVLLLFFIVFSRFGLKGILISILLVYIPYYFLVNYYSCQILSLSFRRIISKFLILNLFFFALVGITFYIKWYFDLSQVIYFVLSNFLIVFSYFCYLFLFEKGFLFEIKNLLKGSFNLKE